MPAIYLCKLSELDELQTRGFTLPLNNENQDIFIVRKNNTVYAYKNTCPHAGAPLNWQPDIFLNEDKTHIQCAMHGAQFTIESGACIYGPCPGDHLESLKLNINAEGEIYLHFCENSFQLSDR